MSLVDFIFNKVTGAKIGLLQLDASIEERHVFECEITEHTMEDQGIVADHIVNKPPIVEIHGKVTNSPIVYLASINAESPIVEEGVISFSSQDRVTEAFEYIREHMEQKTIVDVVTSIAEYSDMKVIVSSITRTPKDELDVTFSLKKIEKASVEMVDIPLPTETKGIVDKGKGGTKPPKAVQTVKAKSSAKVAKDALFSALGLG